VLRSRSWADKAAWTRHFPLVVVGRDGGAVLSYGAEVQRLAPCRPGSPCAVASRLLPFWLALLRRGSPCGVSSRPPSSRLALDGRVSPLAVLARPASSRLALLRRGSPCGVSSRSPSLRLALRRRASPCVVAPHLVAFRLALLHRASPCIVASRPPSSRLALRRRVSPPAVLARPRRRVSPPAVAPRPLLSCLASRTSGFARGLAAKGRASRSERRRGASPMATPPDMPTREFARGSVTFSRLFTSAAGAAQNEKKERGVNPKRGSADPYILRASLAARIDPDAER
jgi:hypothetical protein